MFSNLKEGTQLMGIYTTFVSKNQLISPINGYVCQRITKQNIKQFGFDSIESLHKEYPSFPLSCQDLIDKRRFGASKTNSMLESVYESKRQEKQESYENSPNKCKNCNKTLRYQSKRNNFCSISCSNSHRIVKEETKEKIRKSRILSSEKKPQIYDSCVVCSKHCIVKKRKYHVCDNKDCKDYVRKISGSVGGRKSSASQNRRSRDEVKLYNLLKNHYSSITCNDPIANGWDADILLHDHKIAILWNGPWHYKEMGFRNHSLKQVVNRDCIKIEEFEKIGWSVLIFEDFMWSPEEALIEVIMVARERIELSNTGL